LLAVFIAVALWLSAHAMDSQHATLPIALDVVYRRHRQACQAKVTGLMAAPAPYGEDGSAEPMVPSGCEPKNVETQKSSIYLAWRLATAEIQLAAVMMTRTRIVQRCIRVKFTLFHSTSAELFFSCCGSVAAPRERPGHHDQVSEKNSKRRHGHRPNHHNQVPATHTGRCCGKRPGNHFSNVLETTRVFSGNERG
jgi:hypothetical protein